jgi:hypothetical protein
VRQCESGKVQRGHNHGREGRGAIPSTSNAPAPMWAWLAHHRGPMGHWHGNIPVYDEATKLKQQCGGVES